MYFRPAIAPKVALRVGFTLIELLVVMGIISVLASMVMSGLARARREAKAIQCLSNIRELAIGLNAYASAWRGRYPPNWSESSPTQYWHEEARIGSHIPLPPPSVIPTSSVFVCPDDELSRRSYAMNLWASSKVDSKYVSSKNSDGSQKVPEGILWSANTAKASQLVLLVEAWSYTGFLPAGLTATAAIGGEGLPGNRFGANGGLPLGTKARIGTINSEVNFSRHRRPGAGGVGNDSIGRAAVAFADGHAEMLANTSIVEYDTGRLTGDCLWSLMDAAK